MPNTGQRIYYFSDSIKIALAKIEEYPLTIVEAPSGFGKTTAIREFIKARLPLGARESWYTCFGEPLSVTWDVITEMIADANVEFAARLKKLEIIRDFMYLPAILRSIRFSAETYFVIDNYQLVDCNIPQLTDIISTHDNPNLHIIIITQYTEPPQLFHNDRVYLIRTPVFLFDLESTARLFRMEGVNLSRKELDAVFACTEGWVSAIRLQIANYKENGFLGLTIGIEQLVEMAIWNKLTSEEKDFLQSVAVMDSFDARQAAIMSGENMLPENIEKLLRFNEFIRYNPTKRLYTLHSILREYLLNHFYYFKSLDFQQRILCLVGQCYAAVSQFHTAAQFFYKAGDYDAIFALPINDAYIGNRKEDDILGFIKELINHCPEQTLLKYPSVLIRFSSHLYAGGYFETYQKLRRLIELSIEKGNFNEDELYGLRSEYFIMTLMEEYIEGGGRRQKLPKFWDTAQNIRRDIPFTFGCPSVLFLFWREEGQLENEMHNLAENLPVYCKIAQGHGSGADSLMRAEASLMRGEDSEAETLCHMAHYQAKNCENQQICICLGAEFVLARIAILRGDVEAYFSAISNIESYADAQSELYVRRMAELCLAGLNYIIGDTRLAAPWISDLDSIRKILYYPVVPYALIIYSDILINKQQYNEYLGLFQAVLGSTGMHNMLLKLYFYKYLSIVNLRNGNYQKAQAFYNQAISISLADKVYLPLAQQAEETSSLLLSAKSASTKEGMDALIALTRRQKRGVTAIKSAVFKAQSPLTPREREIALLVKDRFSAQEIAERLYISKATVKTVIRNIYSKLNIHSRSDLFAIEI